MKQQAYDISPILLACLCIALIGEGITIAYQAKKRGSIVLVAPPSTIPISTSRTVISPSPTATTVATDTASTVLSPTANLTLGWKVYDSQAQGLNFKFPSQWQIDDFTASSQKGTEADGSPSKIELSLNVTDSVNQLNDSNKRPSYKDFIVIVTKKTDTLSLSDWLIGRYNLGQLRGTYKVGPEVTVAGKAGYVSITSCCASKHESYTVINGTSVFEFGTSYFDITKDLTKDAASDEFTKFIHSIVFTN